MPPVSAVAERSTELARVCADIDHEANIRRLEQALAPLREGPFRVQALKLEAHRAQGFLDLGFWPPVCHSARC